MSSVTRWLDVEVGTDDIVLNTLPSNLSLMDLHNDNEFKLLVGDLGKGEESPKLKVFKGAMQVSDMVVPDLPLGVVGFYTNETMPRSPPIIAVAFSSCIYMYRNMKIFYKYYLPSVELSSCEMEIWKQLTDPQNHNSEVILALSESLKAIPEKVLTPQSRQFLKMNEDQQLEYLEQLTEIPTKKVPEISCIATLKQQSVDRYSISCLVVGSEDGEVVILETQTFTQVAQGKKHWSINLEHRPVAMCLIPVVHLGITLTGIALASGHVHLYDGKARRDTLFVRDVASVMKFGQLGQEEHVLIIVTGGGNLMLKILKRTADFHGHAAGVDFAASPIIAQRPWLIPKKSKLFLEQSMRERETASVMHETFQLELNRLRLLAAKTLLEAHVKCDNSIGAGVMEPVRLTAEVEGLGPVFRVALIIENTSADKAVIGLSILFHVHTSNYKVSHPYIKVPLISPGSKLKFPTILEEVFEENINPDVFFRNVTGQGGESALVKVLLLKKGRPAPVLAATVQMPPTDPMMLPYEKLQSTQHFDQSAQ